MTALPRWPTSITNLAQHSFLDRDLLLISLPKSARNFRPRFIQRRGGGHEQWHFLNLSFWMHPVARKSLSTDSSCSLFFISKPFLFNIRPHHIYNAFSNSPVSPLFGPYDLHRIIKRRKGVDGPLFGQSYRLWPMLPFFSPCTCSNL